MEPRRGPKGYDDGRSYRQGMAGVGQEFRVVENDGFEYVQEKEEIDWLTA